MTHRRRHQPAFDGYRLQGTIRHSCTFRKPTVAVPEVIEGKRVTGLDLRAGGRGDRRDVVRIGPTPRCAPATR
jgi:hypothetical protein